MIYIYNEGPQYCDWQMAYRQLYQKFASLKASYECALEGEALLRSKIERVKNENQQLKKRPIANNPQIAPQNECSSFDPQLPESQKEITAKPAKKKQTRIKKQHSTQIDSIGSASIYECTYHNCNRVYSSPVSLNLHIKTKHNGGTKKEREAYAKMIITANQRGEPLPNVDINFPPNFLEQFKITYEYMKKYNM